MLATCTGANCGASSTTTRLPDARSITSKSSAGICAHSTGLEAAIASVGVLGGAGALAVGAAATSDRAGKSSNLRTDSPFFVIPPVPEITPPTKASEPRSVFIGMEVVPALSRRSRGVDR